MEFIKPAKQVEQDKHVDDFDDYDEYMKKHFASIWDHSCGFRRGREKEREEDQGTGAGGSENGNENLSQTEDSGKCNSVSNDRTSENDNPNHATETSQTSFVEALINGAVENNAKRYNLQNRIC